MLIPSRPPSSAPPPPPPSSSQTIRIPKPWAPIPTTTNKSSSPWVTNKTSTNSSIAALPPKSTPSPSLSSEENPHAMAIYAASDHSAQQTKDKGGLRLELLSKHNREPHKTLWLPAFTDVDRTYVLGRSADVTLDDHANFIEPVCLQGRVVSRKHLYIKIGKGGTSVTIKDLKSSHGTVIEATPQLPHGALYRCRQVTNSTWWPIKTGDRLFLGKGVTRSGRDYRPLQYEVKVIAKPTSTSASAPVGPYRDAPIDKVTSLSKTIDAINATLAKYAPPKPREANNVIRLTDEDLMESDEIPWAIRTVAQSSAPAGNLDHSPVPSAGSSIQANNVSAKAIGEAEKAARTSSSGAPDMTNPVSTKADNAEVAEPEGREEEGEHEGIAEDSISDDEHSSEEDLDATPVDDPAGYDASGDQSLGSAEDREWSPCDVHDDSDVSSDSELNGSSPRVHESELHEMCFDTERDEREHMLRRHASVTAEHLALSSDSQVAERALFFAKLEKITQTENDGSAKTAAELEDVAPPPSSNMADDDHAKVQCRCEQADCDSEGEGEEAEADAAFNYALWRRATLRMPSLGSVWEDYRKAFGGDEGHDSPVASKVASASSDMSKSVKHTESSELVEESENALEANVDEHGYCAPSAENIGGDDAVEDEGPADAEDLNNDSGDMKDANESDSDNDSEESAEEDESIDSDDDDDDEESVEEGDVEEKDESTGGGQLDDNEIQTGGNVSADARLPSMMEVGCERLPIVPAGLKRSIDEVEPEDSPQSTNEGSPAHVEEKTDEVVTTYTSPQCPEEATSALSATPSSSALAARARASLDRVRTVKRPRLSVGIDAKRVRDVACGVALGAVGTFFGLAAVGATVDGA
ncbi:hypothetical protein BCV69DRAFT_278745 [Microstroma glucosiphilum]|uniref:FHA domain-containing protein n=1 Tax=Pseudomicrostroma glucosiphilum TaxID=1684307 RepID=A0A316U119_9BASI|nr:hypothetical protein BCV69DRAFT_278745 [Pseudomicrostroma glucosiphilum]PWN18564.1 hypothetical protein BCV69DRAFT_278745 [Pseudomicrostroma glucosiphilum]